MSEEMMQKFVGSRPVRHFNFRGLKGLILGDFKHFLAGSVLSKVLSALGIEAVSDPDHGYSFAIKWAPWSKYVIPPELRPQLRRAPIINDTNFFCAKTNVLSVFEKVFGYPLSVDPTSISGLCVAKSDTNALHDGQVIECPVAAKEAGKVYELVLDNLVDGGYVEDLRVPIIGTRIPFVYLKYRPLKSRFSNENSYAVLAGKHEVLSQEELGLINGFVQKIGLQYGEIDVLRDRPSKRIYVVDANNTPYGPPNHIEPRDGALAVTLLADAFAEAFLHPSSPFLTQAARAPYQVAKSFCPKAAWQLLRSLRPRWKL